MTCPTPARIAPSGPDPKRRPITEQARKEEADRAFEEGVRWFLKVSRQAVCQTA